MHIREEEALARGRWLENIRASQGENEANKRKTALRVKVIFTQSICEYYSLRFPQWETVRNLCEKIGEFHGENRIDYLRQIAAAQE